MLKYKSDNINGESKTLELKENIPQKDQVVKTCIAFANGAGCKIIIGFKDKKKDMS